MSFPEGRALLLDAHLRHSIAITRSLGRQGVAVIGASPVERFPAKYSRYMEASVRFDAGTSDRPTELLAILQQHRADVVIAGGLPGNEFLCRHRDELEGKLRAPFNDLDAYNLLSNKARTMDLAASLGVAHPVTAQVQNPDQADEIAAEVGFPMVFKSPIDQGTVRYPRNAEELKRCIAEFLESGPNRFESGLYPLVQQYVEGPGHGFFGLGDHGALVAYFMHRRLHEVPPSGGPSAMAMSYRDRELLELGERFFSATRWHGAAMVEFKKSLRDDRYYLMEVNPKFWGSLDLAIASGVDFPALLYRLLVGASMPPEAGVYRDGTVFRWLTMDLAHAVAVRNVRAYLRAFADKRIRDDADPTDPLPTIALFATGVGRYVGPRAGARTHRARE